MEASMEASFSIMTVEQFKREKGPYGTIVHIKGFDRGVTAAGWKQEALGRIAALNCDTVAWDGDAPREDGFGGLVPEFLRADPGHRAVAFKEENKIQSFQEKLKPFVAEFKDRIIVVSVDVASETTRLGLENESDHVKAFPQGQQPYFFLGRIALKVTGAKHVVAIGGGGVAGAEATASFADEVQWTVLAYSRGKAEAHPTLLDWANDSSQQENLQQGGRTHLEFVTGVDPLEKEGYKGGKKKCVLYFRFFCFAHLLLLGIVIALVISDGMNEWKEERLGAACKRKAGLGTETQTVRHRLD